MAVVKKIETDKVVDFVEDFTKAHGEPPTYKVVADTFHIARSTVAYHLSKSKNGREAGGAAVPSGAFLAGVYRQPALAPPAVTPEYSQERERIRRTREEAVMHRHDYGRPDLKLVRPEPGVGSATPVEAPDSAAAPGGRQSDSPVPVERPEPVGVPEALPGFLFAAMVVIGTGCAAMSAINTAMFLLNSGRPAPLAVATAILTALFSGTAFFAGSLCFKHKNIFAGGLFCLLAVCIIVFSVFSSIAVSYENLKTAEASSVEAREFASQTAVLLGVNAREQAAVSETIAAVTAGQERLRVEAEYWANKSWAKHDALQARISAAEQSIGSERMRQGELLVEERALNSRGIETAAASTKTIYSFLSGGDMRVERGLRFAALAVPAVFFDIASPLMLCVALLFLQKRKDLRGLRLN
jgi:hypothetical protein